MRELSEMREIFHLLTGMIATLEQCNVKTYHTVDFGFVHFIVYKLISTSQKQNKTNKTHEGTIFRQRGILAGGRKKKDSYN